MRWHKWFAWRPVWTYDEGWKWLRTVHRRLFYFPDGLPGAPGPMWEYRAER